MTRQRVSAQTSPEFEAAAANYFEHLDPAQQVNRDFVIDVVLERSVRTFHFDVTVAAYAWLCE